MKKSLIIIAVAGLLLTGCLPVKKIDETKTTGEPNNSPVIEVKDNSLEELEKEADQLKVEDLKVEDFDKDLDNLEVDINQL